jgi:hypothetical protein
MGRVFAMSISKGQMHLSILQRKTCWNLCCPCKHCKNEKRYDIDDVLMSHLIKHGFIEDYRCWNKHGEKGFNEAEMRDLYLEREVPTSVEEDHDDVNEADILGFTDDDIKF